MSSWFDTLALACALHDAALVTRRRTAGLVAGSAMRTTDPEPSLAAMQNANATTQRTISGLCERVASAPVLLVACDYDGTLSQLVPHSKDATTHPDSLTALDRLASQSHTHVAVISGRPRADLVSRFSSIPSIHLVGSHGAEVDESRGEDVSQEAHLELSMVTSELERLAGSFPGVRIERKPHGVALHYRDAPEEVVAKAIDHTGAIMRDVRHLTIRLGSMVVEFATDRSNKGIALELLRRRVGATAVLFVGDDLTDEHAFASLTQGDVGVKVGRGESRAGHRLSDVDEVAQLLTRLAEERQTWLGARGLTPLHALSIISDLRTSAVVDGQGRVVWLCLPRLDSPPLFAALLGSDEHGWFGIHPCNDNGAAESDPSSQYFDQDTLVLRTKWQRAAVTDYFDCGGGRAFQRAGRSDLIRVIEGGGRVKITFSPRLDFGRSPTRISLRESGLEIEGGMDSIVLHAPAVEWTIRSEGRHQSAEAVVSLDSGPIILELRYGTPSSRPHPRPESQRRLETSLFWSNWCKSLRVQGTHAATLRQSALMLRALCYGPSGAIAAAATTSLPEHLGGSRNWDYRFCWPRDAALSCSALLRLGNTGTALRFLDWLAAVVDRCESPDRLRPVYTLTGADLGAEGEVGEVPGYGGSKPVRVGNAAAQQVQLDVFGPIVDLIASLAEHGAPLSAEHWRLVRSMVSAVEARWQEPDHGIWELRGPKRHHVHTKAMCFLTVDRAITLHKLETGKDQPRWTELREQIRTDVLAHGYCQQAECFTTAYGSTEPDAAALAVGLVGLVSESDPRWRATVDCVARTLRTGPVVLRYRFDDELSGREGGFHLCTAWLIRAMLSLDRTREARDLLGGMLACVGPRGIMTEQFDARYEVALGNLPQAYSHLALINSILDVEAATLRGSQQP